MSVKIAGITIVASACLFSLFLYVDRLGGWVVPLAFAVGVAQVRAMEASNE